MSVSGDLSSLRRQIRVLAVVSSAENAGLVPLALPELHLLAYLSNALAPVWDIKILDGKLLKRGAGPFYPELQGDVDRLVGVGLLGVAELGYAVGEEQRWHLVASYALHREFADPVLAAMRTDRGMSAELTFIGELAYALSALPFSEMTRLAQQDATYSDPIVAIGSVIDFAEWRDRNYAARAANAFQQFVPGEFAAGGELVHMYVRHVGARLRDRL